MARYLAGKAECLWAIAAAVVLKNKGHVGGNDDFSGRALGYEPAIVFCQVKCTYTYLFPAL